MDKYLNDLPINDQEGVKDEFDYLSFVDSNKSGEFTFETLKEEVEKIEPSPCEYNEKINYDLKNIEKNELPTQDKLTEEIVKDNVEKKYPVFNFVRDIDTKKVKIHNISNPNKIQNEKVTFETEINKKIEMLNFFLENCEKEILKISIEIEIQEKLSNLESDIVAKTSIDNKIKNYKINLNNQLKRKGVIQKLIFEYKKGDNDGRR